MIEFLLDFQNKYPETRFVVQNRKSKSLSCYCCMFLFISVRILPKNIESVKIWISHFSEILSLEKLSQQMKKIKLVRSKPGNQFEKMDT